MNKIARLILPSIVAGTCFLAARATLAHDNERAEAKATLGSAHVSITYARPVLKGRDPLKLIQPGSLWRLGADIPTTIESDAALNFGGTTVPKGKHILLARYVEPGRWSIVISSKGVRQYDPNAKIAEAPATFENGKDSVEGLEIQITSRNDEGVIEIAWGTLRLQAPFTVAK